MTPKRATHFRVIANDWPNCTDGKPKMLLYLDHPVRAAELDFSINYTSIDRNFYAAK